MSDPNCTYLRLSFPHPSGHKLRRESILECSNAPNWISILWFVNATSMLHYSAFAGMTERRILYFKS
jgi:hypothetical protein